MAYLKIKVILGTYSCRHYMQENYYAYYYCCYHVHVARVLSVDLEFIQLFYLYVPYMLHMMGSIMKNPNWDKIQRKRK